MTAVADPTRGRGISIMLEACISRTKAGEEPIFVALLQAVGSLAIPAMRTRSSSSPYLCLLEMPCLEILALLLTCVVFLPSTALLALRRVLFQVIVMSLSTKVP